GLRRRPGSPGADPRPGGLAVAVGVGGGRRRSGPARPGAAGARPAGWTCPLRGHGRRPRAPRPVRLRGRLRARSTLRGIEPGDARGDGSWLAGGGHPRRRDPGQGPRRRDWTPGGAGGRGGPLGRPGRAGRRSGPAARDGPARARAGGGGIRLGTDHRARARALPLAAVNPEEYQRMFEAEETQWWYAGMRAISLALLSPELPARPDSVRILDAGCGTGNNLRHLARHGRAVGVDLSDEALRFCRARGVPAAKAELLALPFPDASFDCVTSFDVLYHRWVADDRAAVAEMARVLRPGG